MRLDGPWPGRAASAAWTSNDGERRAGLRPFKVHRMTRWVRTVFVPADGSHPATIGIICAVEYDYGLNDHFSLETLPFREMRSHLKRVPVLSGAV